MMDITVRDLIELKLLTDIEVLSGEQSLINKITTVIVLDGPDEIEWIQGGEFVLTSLYPFQEQSDQLKLIKNLVEKNAAGLGIKLKGPIPDGMIDLAREHEFPLIHIPYYKTWVELINPIMAEILNRQLVILEKSNVIRRSFNKEVLNGGKLITIAKALSELINNPVTIVEQVYKTIETWPAYLKGIIDENDIIQSTYRKNQSNHIITTIDQSMNGKLFAINVAGRIEGYIIVWRAELIKELDEIAIEHAIAVAALHIQQLKAVNEVNQRFKDDFMYRLLRGEFTDTYVRRTSQEFGWEINQENSVALIKTIQLKKHDWKESYKIFTLFKNTIKMKHGLEIPMGMDGNDILCLIPGNVKKRYESLIHTILETKSKILSEEKSLIIPIGIGKPYDATEKLPESFKEACTACQVSKLLNTDFCQYSELGPYALLINLLELKETEDYLSRYIYPIIDFDQKNNTKIFSTLETFINLGCNYRETAKKLYVHHNTIRYRIEIMEKMLEIDFKAPETPLNMMLALKLFRLKE